MIDRSLLGDLGLAAASAVALVVVLSFVFSDVGASVGEGSGRLEAIGSVVRRTNQVRRRLNGDLVWNGIGDGATVYQADAVFVGPGSDAVIVLDDGSRIEIDESSMVVIRRAAPDAADAEPVVDVQILRGGARGRAGRRRGGGVVLRAGRLAARLSGGAEARVRLGKDRTARVSVSRGSAIVVGEDGEAVEVNEGQRQIVDAAGRRIGGVETLALELERPERGARRFLTGSSQAVELVWKAVAGKGPYLIEVASDPDFESIAYRSRSEKLRIVVAGLSTGVYFWRVKRGTRGAAKDGGEVAREERKLTLVDDRPPVPYRPLAGSIVDLSYGRSLSLAWGAVPDVRAYVVELTRGSNFKTPLFSSRIDRPSHMLRPGDHVLEEGDHCFRVRSDEPERGVSPWSHSVCFRVVTSPVLPPPDLLDPMREDDKPGRSGQRGNFLLRLFIGTAHAAQPTIRPVLLRWKKLPGAVYYVIEIARDRAFSKVVMQEKVDTNYFRWNPPERREYHWRVHGVDADGRAGKFSPPRVVGIDLPGPSPQQPAAGATIEYASAPPRVTLGWQATDRYTSYEVQIARDAAFSRDTVQLESKAARIDSVEYRPGALGVFHWRIVGVRASGERSLPGPTSQFTVVPAAPRALEPIEGAMIALEGDEAKVEVTFKWSQRPVQRYQFQIAIDARFESVVADATVGASSAKATLEKAGTYFWRVRATAPATDWGRRAEFVVAPAPPAILDPEDGAELVLMKPPLLVTLRWARVPDASSYRVTVIRLADDSKPESAAVPIDVEGTETPFEISEAGTYRWSVKALVDSGLESADSPARSFGVGQVVVAVDPLPEVCAEGQPCVDGTGCKGDPECNDPVVSEPAPAVLHVGPRLGLVYNLGEIATGVFSAEVGYRLPQLDRRVGVALNIGYYTDPLDFTDNTSGVSLTARLHAMPIELVAVYILSTPFVDVTGGGGFGLTFTHTTITVEGQTQSSNHYAWSGVARVGAERELGPGWLFADLSFFFGSRSKGLVETQAGGIKLAVGFRVFVW